MVQRIDKILVGACAALALTTAFAAAVTNDFESAEAGTTPTGWTGNGTVAVLDETHTYDKKVGRTITTEGQSYTHVLAVSGQSVRTYGSDEATSGETVTVDMMVKVMAADEIPDAPESTSDLQVAVATGPVVEGKTVAPLYYYSGSSSGWVSTEKTYETNTWVRLMMAMDYANSQCIVTVDGDRIATVAYVGTPATSKKVSSVTVEGATAIDDIVVTASDKSASEITPFPADAKSDTAKVSNDDGTEVAVKLNWLYKNGLDGETVTMTTQCGDTSGMTYAEKYEAGLDINDNKKFEVTSMKVTDANTAAFTVPGQADAYEVVIDADGTQTTVDPTVSTADGVTTATVDLSKVTDISDKKVIKFQLKAKAQ